MTVSATAQAITIMREQPPSSPVEISQAEVQRIPCVFSSPHSGRYYPPEFLAQSQLDALTLRRSEDSFIDELIKDAALQNGAPVVAMAYPRAYIDVNRAPYELDPTMYKEPLPMHADTKSERVAGGLGTIPRIVSAGLEIYSDPLSYKDAEERIDTVYRPFHTELQNMLDKTHEKFGFSLLIDWHSMPSMGQTTSPASALKFRRTKPDIQADIVLGDRFGTSCSPHIADWVEDRLKALGYRTTRNTPYAGGFIARSYGKPQHHNNVLQIEISRALYMDERRIVKHAGFDSLQNHLNTLIHALGEQSLLWAQNPKAQAEAAE